MTKLVNGYFAAFWHYTVTYSIQLSEDTSLAQLMTNSSHPSRVLQEIIFFSPQMPQLYTSS